MNIFDVQFDKHLWIQHHNFEWKCDRCHVIVFGENKPEYDMKIPLGRTSIPTERDFLNCIEYSIHKIMNE